MSSLGFFIGEKPCHTDQRNHAVIRDVPISPTVSTVRSIKNMKDKTSTAVAVGTLFTPPRSGEGQGKSFLPNTRSA